ncbi:MAG: ComEC/Rec2 family competence protein [Candidatus Paceibacterota bacterium]|jgi:competence protein ComEC
MKNNSILTISIAGFISAIFLCSFIKIGVTFSIFLIFLSIILLIYRKLIIIDLKRNPSQIKSQSDGAKEILYLVIFLLSFSLGIFRYELKDSKSLDINLENNIGNKIIIEGVISDEPTRKDKQAVLVVDFKNIIVSSSNVLILGKGIVSTDLYPELKYGDLIKITGKLEKPENFPPSNGSTTSEFDYVSYLSKDDIYYQIDFAKTEFISGSHGNIIKSILFKIKNAFLNNINKTISSPESSLLSGILLGTKSSMDENTTEIFRKAGLSHIVALSGYNITVVADAIMKVFSFLPKNFGFIGGIIGIILFIIMSGASSTAVRAGVMALIVILAQITRRNYQAGRALVFAGFLMILINPKILVFDISFELSFLATIAIIYVSPVLKEKFSFITDKFGLRDIISSTISAQILVLPLILYKMGLLSLVALPANILVLAFIPASMLFGFITGMFGFIWIPLSLPFAWISWLLLAYIISIAKIFANLPFSSVNISWFSFGIMIISYIFITLWILYENQKILKNNK